MPSTRFVDRHWPGDHYFQSLCLLVLHVVWNHTKIVSWCSPWSYLYGPRSVPHYLSVPTVSSLDDDVYLYQNKKGRKSKLWWVEKPIKLSYKVCLLWINKERGKEKTLNRLIYEYRCESRLKTKNEESTRLVDTGLVVELEHLKTKTRLLDKKLVSVRGECDI